MSVARALSVLVALLVIGSGVVGLVARSRSPAPARPRQAVFAWLRVATGVFILVLVLLFR